MDDAAYGRAVASAAARYGPAGRFAVGFARGKLAGDPVYRALLDRGIADAASIADLGCGRGLLVSLVLETRASSVAPDLIGLERDPGALRLARLACGGAARFVEADLSSADVPPADAVALLDVLHYLRREDQQALLLRIRRALRPGGRLFVREADAAAGARFLAVRAGERLAALARGDGWPAFAFRGADELALSLASMGFAVATSPMGAGTPFANVLLEATAP